MGRSMHLGKTQFESISMITIRKATMQDCDTILQWENNPLLWEVTDEPGPFDKSDISSFLFEQNSLEHAQQERWIIEMKHEPIGMLDFFQWDPQKKSIGVGIALPNPETRKKGYATEALKIAHQTLKMKYDVQSFHCVIHPNNADSLRLFEKLGYEKIQSEWHRHQLVNRYIKFLS
jgi:diamine N-acetyltransferase